MAETNDFAIPVSRALRRRRRLSWPRAESCGAGAEKSRRENLGWFSLILSHAWSSPCRQCGGTTQEEQRLRANSSCWCGLRGG